MFQGYVVFNFGGETETKGSIPFMDILVKRGTIGQISTSVFRKATHTGLYLNYWSEHPLQHKRSVVNTHRPDAICNNERNGQTEILQQPSRHPLSKMPERVIHFPNKRDQSMQKKRNTELSLLPYYPGLTVKFNCCLRSNNVKVASKPIRKIGDILGSTKYSINKTLRQGVIYSITCYDCHERYIGVSRD